MGSKVLLADDSVTIQKVVGIIFANEGYDLTIVASGDAAVARARELKPDVMLVDAFMPGKNGYEVCREIRQDPTLAHTAILLMTGAFEVVDEEKNRQSGADEFIIKPFESQALIDVTNRLAALTKERLARPAPVAAPPAAAAPSPIMALPPDVDDIWASGFDDEPAVAPVAAPAAADFFAEAAPAAAPESVKATAADDLWGAFDMDEIETTAAPLPVASAADNMFSFEEETPIAAAAVATDEFVLDEIAFDEPLPAAAPTVTGFEPVGEQEIFFADETPVMMAAPAVTVPYEDDFGTISFDEPQAVPLPVVAEIAAAPPAAPEPVVAETVVAAVPTPEPVVAAPVPATMDEAQLRALLATISRDIIEKIVWEIVPDLAETLIREEIRKLKAGLA